MIPLQTAKAELAPSDDDFETDNRDDGEAIVTLHNRTVDVLAGYTKMVEKAEPMFKVVAERFRALHAEQADSLARLLARLGHDADEDGTLMGTFNVAVVSLRALFDSIDTDVMDNIRRGEDTVLSAFDDAIEKTVDRAAQSELRDMRAALTSLLDQTRHLG